MCIIELRACVCFRNSGWRSRIGRLMDSLCNLYEQGNSFIAH